MRYLLDANIISVLVSDPRGRVAEQIGKVGEDNVFTSVIVRAEILFGLRKRKSEELDRKVYAILQRLYTAPFEPPADEAYAQIRERLSSEGRIIGPNDLLIAAHAMALDAVLVTDNVKEFSRIAGLKVENWIR